MQNQREKQSRSLKPAPDPTCRVFFDELLKSDFFIKENEETFLVTPTCAKCNMLFGVGEIKEVEKRGNITKIKISDPTATLNIYTAEVIPSGPSGDTFLAFVAHLHVRSAYEGAEKNKGVLILVEEAEPVKEHVRNNWIIHTARRTMERIEQLRTRSFEWKATSSAFRNAEKEALPKKQWLMAALEHYSIDDAKLDLWGYSVINVVKGLWQFYNKTAKEAVLEALEESEKRSMDRVKLIKILKAKGLTEEWVEEIIDGLIEEGRCYEPEVGAVKVVEE